MPLLTTTADGDPAGPLLIDGCHRVSHPAEPLFSLVRLFSPEEQDRQVKRGSESSGFCCPALCGRMGHEADVSRGSTAMAVELAELIAQLRADLAEAMRAGADSELRFELGPVELELTVALEKSGGADAKVRFWVVEAGADGRAATTTTQRIKLTLDPRSSSQPGRRLQISGAEEEGER